MPVCRPRVKLKQIHFLSHASGASAVGAGGCYAEGVIRTGPGRDNGLIMGCDLEMAV